MLFMKEKFIGFGCRFRIIKKLLLYVGIIFCFDLDGEDDGIVVV